MPSDRCPDVPVSNARRRFVFCKYLDAYANAMTWVSFVQSKRTRDLLVSAERSSGFPSVRVERKGVKCGDLLELDSSLRVLPAPKPIPRMRWPTFGCHLTCSLARARQCPPQQARESASRRPLRRGETVRSVRHAWGGPVVMPQVGPLLDALKTQSPSPVTREGLRVLWAPGGDLL